MSVDRTDAEVGAPAGAGVPDGSSAVSGDGLLGASGHRDRIRVLTTVLAGGFLWQARSVMARLGDEDYEFLLATAPEDRADVQAEFPGAKLHVVAFPSSSALERIGAKLLAPLLSFWQCAKLVFRARPDVVLCLGTCLAIPLFLWGRLAGARTVFVESITRVTRLSMTGRTVLWLGLADRFYVQWPQVARAHRRALYRGCVL